MQFIRTYFTIILLALLFPSLRAEETVEVWTTPGWQNDYTLATTLTTSDNSTYFGILNISGETRIILKFKGNTYHSAKWVNGYEVNPVGNAFEFSINSYENMMLKDFGSYTIKAVPSSDNTTISVEFLQPTPLNISIDNSSSKLLDNVTGYTGTAKYGKTISVAPSSSKTINGFTVGNTTYGFASAPKFTDATNAQSQTVNITSGGQAITLDKRGNYTLTVNITNGIPTSCTIDKGEVVPDVRVNSNLLSYSNGTYTGTVTLAKNSTITVDYDGRTTYYIQSDITGSLESPSGKVNLGTSDKSAKVITRGNYDIIIDIANKTLTYTNTNPPQPSTLSPTLPEGFVSCDDASSYIPDEPMTVWYNTTDGQSQVGNYGANYLEVFLLGNGRMGMTTLCKSSETFPIHEKTNYDAIRNVDYSLVYSVGNYNPICNIVVTGNNDAYGTSILRQLDLTTAVASAINRNGENSRAREYLISKNYNVGVIHYTTDGDEKLTYSFTTSLSGTAGSDGTVSATSGNTKNCDIRYNVTLKVTQNGGTLSSSGSTVTVTDAKEITLYYTISTNYDIDSTNECYSGESDSQLAERSLAVVNKAASAGWKAVYDDHIAEYSPLFNSVTFRLADASNDAPAKTLKAHYDGRYSNSCANSDDQTRAVDMLLFGMGRYLNLASSRGNLALPSNLQGIWADENPQWGCDFHNNINLQMNYWASENTNIPAAHMPFLNYLKKMASKRWTNYADKIGPGTGGWTTHLLMNTFGSIGSYNGYYTESAAWNCAHIWQHYQYSHDRRFLADFFDTMYGACKFYFGYLKDTDGDGQFEIPNYYSPELTNGGSVATHAQQLVYQHLCNTRDAAKILGKTAEADKCQEYIDKMYNGIDVVNGEQCEWKGSLTSEVNHRHLSHIMSLYPLAQVSPYDDDRTNFDGSYQALLTRGDTDGGENAAWNTGWKMNCYARSLEGDLALRQLAYGMAERITPDLRSTCKHTFQIEGGAGIAAGMAEMLLQSYSGVIDLLPALPEQSWHGGSIKGLKAVGNYEVAIEWEDNAMTSATITDCLNGTMREGTEIRVHGSRLPGDINLLQVNGVNVVDEATAVYSRANSVKPTYRREERTDSYVVTIPAGSPKVTKITFGEDISTGIDSITPDSAADDANAPVEYFNLQGIRVATPTHGLYIRRQGNVVTKILIE